MAADTKLLHRLLDTAFDPVKEYLVGTKNETQPTWYLALPDGELEVIVTPWNGDFQKELIRSEMRKHMSEKGAVAYGLSMEAWAAYYPKLGEDERPEVRPSQHPGRVEMVMVMATDGFRYITRSYEILRDHNTGKCRELSPISAEVDSREEKSPSITSEFLNLLGGNA